MASFPYNLPHFHIFSFVTINLILLYQIYSAIAYLGFGGTLFNCSWSSEHPNPHWNYWSQSPLTSSFMVID